MPIDLSIALSHVDGDPQFLAELAAMFIEDYPRLLDELRNSITREDSPEAERAAHTLKGRLAFFGAERARDQALRLELMIRQCELDAIPQALAELEAEIEDALPQFNSLAKGHGS